MTKVGQSNSQPYTALVKLSYLEGALFNVLETLSSKNIGANVGPIGIIFFLQIFRRREEGDFAIQPLVSFFSFLPS